jgi:hypothetical protein
MGDGHVFVRKLACHRFMQVRGVLAVSDSMGGWESYDIRADFSVQTGGIDSSSEQWATLHSAISTANRLVLGRPVSVSRTRDTYRTRFSLGKDGVRVVTEFLEDLPPD